MNDIQQYTYNLDRITDLKQRIEKVLPYIDFENEAALREMLIAPIIIDLIYYYRAKLRIEYFIQAENR